MKRKTLLWISFAVLALAAVAYAAVSVEEIVRLNDAGLSEEALLLVVQSSDTPDTLSTDQVTEMIDANVPDTVIGLMVAKADAVLEDWEPVDLDEVFDDRDIYDYDGYDGYSEFALYDTYPAWGGYWGYPRYEWCGTPYYWGYYRYAGWYDPYYGPWYDPWWAGSWAVPRSGFYVGIGWGGSWTVGVNYGSSYCGFYDPWWYSGSYCGYWGSQYNSWNDPGCFYSGNDYYSYRVYDRPDYHNGGGRRGGLLDGITGEPFRDNTFSGTLRSVTTLDTRKFAGLDRDLGTKTDRTLRDGLAGRTSKTADNLRSLGSTTSDKSRLANLDRSGISKDRTVRGTDKSVDIFKKENSKIALADRTTGRTVTKGTDKSVRDLESKGRTLDVHNQVERSNPKVVTKDAKRSVESFLAGKSDSKKTREAGNVDLFKKSERTNANVISKGSKSSRSLDSYLSGKTIGKAEPRKASESGVIDHKNARDFTTKSKSTPRSTESTSEKVNRYVKMKDSQRSSGQSVKMRSGNPDVHVAPSRRDVIAPSGSHREEVPAPPPTRHMEKRRSAPEPSEQPAPQQSKRSAPREIRGADSPSAPSAPTAAPSRSGREPQAATRGHESSRQSGKTSTRGGGRHGD